MASHSDAPQMSFNCHLNQLSSKHRSPLTQLQHTVGAHTAPLLQQPTLLSQSPHLTLTSTPPSHTSHLPESYNLSFTYPHSPPPHTLPLSLFPHSTPLTNASSWYLTRLELGRHAAYSCSFALEQLTRLCRLTLYEDSADVLLPSVGCLSGLTRLALVDMSAGGISKLKALPPQLLELQLSLARLKKSEELPPGRGRGGDGIAAGEVKRMVTKQDWQGSVG